MKSILNPVAVLTIVFLLATAFTDAQEKQKSAPTYYPMQVGNQWKFKVSVGGNSISAVSKIAKIEKIDDVEMARLEAIINDNVIATEHLRGTAEGVFRHRNNGAEITPPILLLKYPAKDGDKWSGNIKVGAEQAKYTCETKKETVTVPAGKYEALKMDMKLETEKGMSVTTSYWFVKDIGFVKQIVDTGKMTIVMELEEFEKAK